MGRSDSGRRIALKNKPCEDITANNFPLRYGDNAPHTPPPATWHPRYLPCLIHYLLPPNPGKGRQPAPLQRTQHTAHHTSPAPPCITSFLHTRVKGTSPPPYNAQRTQHTTQQKDQDLSGLSRAFRPFISEPSDVQHALDLCN